MRCILLGFLTLLCKGILAQLCTLSVYNDRMETYNWAGNWWTPAPTAGFYTNASVSPSVSAAIYGLGSGSSANEFDWYSLPNITGLNTAYSYLFRMSLGSYRFTNSTASSRGVDVGDFIEIQISTDGGIVYTSEIRVTGNNNAYWNYNNSGIINKTSNGVLTVYTPTAGGDRTTTGDGYSIITLALPTNISQLAVDIFCRVNSAGEEWWIDDIELIELSPCVPLPITLVYFRGELINNSVLLKWKTLSELNTDYFLVERSMDGYNWYFLGKVKSAGNSTNPIDYSLIDEEPKYGYNYYRLTQFDNNGQNEKFNIVWVFVEEGNTCKYKYYDMMGKEINYLYASPGIYIRKCGEKTIEKIWKN
jgi:hypothetical protein